MNFLIFADNTLLIRHTMKKAYYKMMMHEKFFLKARDAAKLSDYSRYHIGCVVVYKNHIISSGFNSTKTHPIQKIYNKERFDTDNTPHSLHAEITALVFLKDRHDIDWKKVEIYTYRENKSGELRMSKPCKSCMALIKSLGISKVNYTINNGYASLYLNNNENK